MGAANWHLKIDSHAAPLYSTKRLFRHNIKTLRSRKAMKKITHMLNASHSALLFSSRRLAGHQK